MNGWTYVALSVLVMFLMTSLGAMIGGAMRERRDR